MARGWWYVVGAGVINSKETVVVRPTIMHIGNIELLSTTGITTTMVSIRKATPADAAIIAEIGKQSFIESHGSSAATADIDEYVAKKYTVPVVAEQLADAGNIIHLIYYDGRVAGYSKINLNTGNEHIAEQNITCLDRLYLLKEFYDLKLGAQLFEYNVAISNQAGQKGIWLYTWVGNTRAISFYARAGFKVIGKTDFKISETHANPNHVMYLEYGR